MKRTAIVVFLLLALLFTTPWGTPTIAWEVMDLDEESAKSVFDVKVGDDKYAIELHYLFDPERESDVKKREKWLGIFQRRKMGYGEAPEQHSILRLL